jgi:hypothetical protein
MHFNVSPSIVKEMLSRELGLRKFYRRSVRHQRYERQKEFRAETSVELLVLLDQYSELQFEGIATGDEPWVCYLIESESTFARRREEVIPRLRPGISMKSCDYDVCRSAAVNCPGGPPERAEVQPKTFRSEHPSVLV